MKQYIDKSALAAWIRSRLHPVVVQHETNYDDWDRGADSERLNILSFIDKLEVKEVDLEKEIEHKIQELTYSSNYTKKYFREIAKHFFELGLKAQKGE